MNHKEHTMVGIVCALGREAKGLAEYLLDKRWDSWAGRMVLHGYLDGRMVTIMNCGVGKARAAAGTQLLIDRYHPRYIINFGTAGAIDDDLRVKDVIASTRAVMYDTDFNDPERTIFEADRGLVELARGLPGVRVGTVCTADRVVSSNKTRKNLAREFQGLCADWEGAATLDVCNLNGIPGIILRVISDNAGSFARLEFLFFHKTAITSGAALVAQFIRRIPAAEGVRGAASSPESITLP